jgi:hypothetical protein
MVDIMTALATAGQAIKLAQELRGIDKAIDAAEFKLKIADLTVAPLYGPAVRCKPNVMIWR